MNTRLSACVFFLKAHTDIVFWENVITTGEYTLDIITTLSGVGNLAKFRHLARLVKIAKAGKKSKELIWSYKAVKTIKGTSAYVEISSGTINALLKLTGVNDTAFGEVLSKYLFYLELFTLTGELAVGIKGYLRNSAEELLEHNDFEKHLDDLVEKGEIDDIAKRTLLREIRNVSGKSGDYSARLARNVSKSLDDASYKIKSFEDSLVKEHKVLLAKDTEALEKGLIKEKGRLVNNSKGILINRTSGNSDYIKWTSSDVVVMKNSTLTHNHPNGSGLSLADLELFLFNRLLRVRAVDPNGGVFSFIRKQEVSDNYLKKLDKKIKKFEEDAIKEYGNGDFFEVERERYIFEKLYGETSHLFDYVYYK